MSGERKAEGMERARRTANIKIDRYLSCLPPSVHHQSSPVRVSLLSPLLLSHEIDGVRKEKERLTAIISPSDPWSVWLPSRSLSGSPAVPRLVGTLRASFLALRAPSGRMTRQAKDEGRSAEMTDGRRDTMDGADVTRE